MIGPTVKKQPVMVSGFNVFNHIVLHFALVAVVFMLCPKCCALSPLWPGLACVKKEKEKNLNLGLTW